MSSSSSLVVKHFVGGHTIPDDLKNNVDGMMDRFQKKRSHFFFFFGSDDDLPLLAVYEMVKKGNTFQLYSMWINDAIPSSQIRTRDYERHTKRMLRQSIPSATILF